MPKDKKIQIICSTCGSTEVSRDATAVWSIQDQDWVLCSVQDQGYCENCDGEASLQEVELENGHLLVEED